MGRYTFIILFFVCSVGATAEDFVKVEVKVIDEETGAPLSASVSIRENNSLDTIALTLISDSIQGILLFNVKAHIAYSITVNKEGYLFQEVKFNTSDKPSAFVVGLRKKRAIICRLIIQNLNFDVGKADIRPDAYVEVYRITEFMKAYPDMRIKFTGYCDGREKKKNSLKLSQKRAENARDVLISKGISADRIEVESKGSENPIGPNNTPEGRAMNRRVEFEVAGK